MLDALYDRALRPAAPGEVGMLVPLSRQALYVRAHWLRMPPLLLAWHLGAKALRREGETTQPFRQRRPKMT